MKRIAIFINDKHHNTITTFKQSITEIEGGYHGYLGDYVAEAIEFYTYYLKNYPEKIGKEKHTISNLSKTQRRVRDFIEYFGAALQPIKSEGMDYITFQTYLKKYFKKSDKTIREYERDILHEAQWSVINIPGTQKRIVLHRLSDLYSYVQRFDVTLNNYYSGLRANADEKLVFSQIRDRLLPATERPQHVMEVENDEGLDFLDSLGGVKE